MQSKNRAAAPESEMTMEERLAKLEKAMRRWRWATLALLIAIGPLLAGTGYLMFGVQRVVRARKLEILNDQGLQVVVLDSFKSGGIVGTRNSHGHPVITLSLDETGDGLLETCNAKGVPMVHVTTTPTGGALRIRNNLGREVVGLQSNKANCGVMMAKDVDGQTQAMLSGSQRY